MGSSYMSEQSNCLFPMSSSTLQLPFVIKRDGKKEQIDFNKITTRIYKLAIGGGLDVNRLKPMDVIQKVIEGVFEGVKTSDLDNIAAKECAYRSTMHPDYGILAARIEASNLQKQTKSTFSETVHDLYHNYDKKNGNHKPIVTKEFYDDVFANKDLIDNAIVHERDYDWTYFGLKTIQGAYLLRINEKVVERPQYMLMRVAVALHGQDTASIIETYECMSKRYYIHASPTLFNAGTHRAGYASCFLCCPEEDSIEAMYELAKECAIISKYSGGIGIEVHNIRSKGSRIHSSNGTSEGLIPYLRVLNNTMRHVTQSSRRPGSMAVYLEPTHPEIFDFIELRTPNGAEEMRARDLWLALWIPDLFMEKVKKNEDWCLFCPDAAPGLSDVYGDEYKELYAKYEREGRYTRKVKARDIFDAAIKAQVETGVPYMSSKDAVNRKANQKHLGVIRSSNLCVAPETRILTKDGYKTISDLENQKVYVWNGEEYSETTVVKTNEDSELMKLTFSNGAELDCTPYHKFHVATFNKYKKVIGFEIKEAHELTCDDKLIKVTYPVINNGSGTMKYPYAAGLFSAGGTVDKEETKVLPSDLPEKYTVPLDCDIDTRLRWLEGFVDGDGKAIACYGKTGSLGIQLASDNSSFLNDIRMMLQTMGIDTKIDQPERDTQSGSKSSHCLLLNGYNLYQLYQLGFRPKRLNLKDIKQPKKSTNRYISLVTSEHTGRRDATYCFNEPLKHRGIFNGLVTSNCNEINIRSSPDEIGVCILASIGLPSFVATDLETGQRVFDHELLRSKVKIVTRNLNKVIDRTDYPLEKARRSNELHRPIGIGISGLADLFCMMRVPFESKEARELNRQVFETIYYAACEASCELAEKFGPYQTYQGSEFSKGRLQFDLWDNSTLSGRWDWDGLKQKIAQHGMRNSLLTAVMPTASTSQILGYSECIEPYSSNIYLRKVLSGEFQVVNTHMLRDLTKRGLWSEKVKKQMIMDNGSIQNIATIPPELKELYKTTWEIKQRSIIDLSADRGPFIDQTQSLNIFFEKPTYQSLLSCHFYAWEKGLKTMMYYLKMTPAAAALKVTMQTTQGESKPQLTLPTMSQSTEEQEEELLACPIDGSCTSCSG